MAMPYSDKVRDHFANPRNVGKMEDADGIGEVGNAVCGDIMKMYLKIDDGIITDAKFNTFGCGAAIATSSMATELIKGQVRGGCAPAHQSSGGGSAGPPAASPSCTALSWLRKRSNQHWRIISPARACRSPRRAALSPQSAIIARTTEYTLKKAVSLYDCRDAAFPFSYSPICQPIGIHNGGRSAWGRIICVASVTLCPSAKV